MSTVVVSVRVAAPRERTFAVFTELERAAERIPGIQALEVLTEGPFRVGTRWRETRVFMKKEATEEMWVTGCDPPRSYAVESASHGMRHWTEFRFEPDGDGTRVTWTFTGKPESLGTKLMAPVFNLLMKGMLKRLMLEDLEALRAVCERGDA